VGLSIKRRRVRVNIKKLVVKVVNINLNKANNISNRIISKNHKEVDLSRNSMMHMEMNMVKKTNTTKNNNIHKVKVAINIIRRKNRSNLIEKYNIILNKNNKNNMKSRNLHINLLNTSQNTNNSSLLLHRNSGQRNQIKVRQLRVVTSHISSRCSIKRKTNHINQQAIIHLLNHMETQMIIMMSLLLIMVES
jgi:hypothetical protein